MNVPSLLRLVLTSRGGLIIFFPNFSFALNTLTIQSPARCTTSHRVVRCGCCTAAGPTPGLVLGGFVCTGLAPTELTPTRLVLAGLIAPGLVAAMLALPGPLAVFVHTGLALDALEVI